MEDDGYPSVQNHQSTKPFQTFIKICDPEDLASPTLFLETGFVCHLCFDKSVNQLGMIMITDLVDFVAACISLLIKGSRTQQNMPKISPKLYKSVSLHNY